MSEEKKPTFPQHNLQLIGTTEFDELGEEYDEFFYECFEFKNPEKLRDALHAAAKLIRVHLEAESTEVDPKTRRTYE